MRRALLFCLVLGASAVPCLALHGQTEPVVQGKPLAYWIGALKNPSSLLRDEALLVLAKAGPAAKGAAPALAGLLKDANPTVRVRAALALGKIGTPPRDMLAILLGAWRTEGPALRAEILGALLQVKPRPKEAAEVFRAGLKDSAPMTRILAADALYEIEKKAQDVLPVYIEVLEKTNDTPARMTAINALQRMGAEAKPARQAIVKLFPAPEAYGSDLPALVASFGPDTIPDLVNMIVNPPDKRTQVLVRMQAARTLSLLGKDGLKPARQLLAHADPLVRRAGLQALGPVGADMRDAVPELVKLLEDTDTSLQRQAMWLLSYLGSDKAVPKLVEIANDKKAPARQEALRALGRIGTTSGAARAALVAAVKEGTFSDRFPALEALWQLDPKAKELAPAARELFADPKGNKTTLCVLVGKMGPAAKEFFPQLAALLNSSNTVDSRVAARAFEDLGPLAKEAAPSLVQALRTNDITTRLTLASILRKLGTEEKAAVGALLDALSKPNNPSRPQVLLALGKFGPKAKDAVPPLLELLRDKAPQTRILAATALYAIDAAQLPAVRPVLQDAMKSPSVFYSMQAALILWQADPKDKAAADVAIQKLQDPLETNRLIAAAAMRRAGPWAKAAIPALTKLLEDPKGQTRVNAALALWHVEPGNKLSEAALVELMRPTVETAVRQQAMNGVRDLGPGAKNAIAALQAATHDPSIIIRNLAADVLRQLAPGKSVLPP